MTSTGSPPRLAAGLVIAFLVGGAAAGTTSDGVGVVAEYRPASSRFSLARDGVAEPVPLRIGTVVMAGDRITLPAGGKVTVQLANEAPREFVGPGTFEIPASGPLGAIAAFFQSFPRVIDSDFRMAGTAAARGGEDCAREGNEIAPIEVPILGAGAVIVAGQRDLPLAWRGGCAPFTVTVLSANEQILYRESVQGRQVRLDAVPLAVGVYSVAITDGTGQKFRASLEAAEAAPALPPEIASDSSPLGMVARAVWLSTQDGGRWRFDSFEYLRPLIRTGDPMAGAIGDGLLWGSSAEAGAD